jgi:hypothetical protein
MSGQTVFENEMMNNDWTLDILIYKQKYIRVECNDSFQNEDRYVMLKKEKYVFPKYIIQK